ncbi:MAG: hypothetical protein Q8941_06505 [Bacteroidota bacterium]|nr:hypothetical protein [Bacteroidota bacterium]
MKTSFLFFFLCLASAVMAQSLRDSLFSGKLKSDTGKTFVSKDTSKYVMLKNEAVTSKPGDKKKMETGKAETAKPQINKVEINKPDESMPDSLNKLYYARQKQWKRFIESNIPIITQQVDGSRKVKKGEYSVEIDYTIGLNGRVTTNGITCSPNNDFIVEQFTELMKRPPVLSPPIYSDGKPRTLSAKQPVTIVKK